MSLIHLKISYQNQTGILGSYLQLRKKKNQRKIVNISLPINLNKCFIETVLLSTHNMFCLRNKKNNFQLHTLIRRLVSGVVWKKEN